MFQAIFLSFCVMSMCIIYIQNHNGCIIETPSKSLTLNSPPPRIILLPLFLKSPQNLLIKATPPPPPISRDPKSPTPHFSGDEPMQGTSRFLAEGGADTPLA